jgi:hypothetical protein
VRGGVQILIRLFPWQATRRDRHNMGDAEIVATFSAPSVHIAKHQVNLVFEPQERRDMLLSRNQASAENGSTGFRHEKSPRH